MPHFTKEQMDDMKKASYNAWRRKYNQENPIWSLLTSIKHRARKNKIPFNLTSDDIEIPDKCPVLGIPLFFSEKKATDNSPSIDRIIPEKGYVKDNIIVTSWRANKIKTNATIDELIKVAEFYKARM